MKRIFITGCIVIGNIFMNKKARGYLIWFISDELCISFAIMLRCYAENWCKTNRHQTTGPYLWYMAVGLNNEKFHFPLKTMSQKQSTFWKCLSVWLSAVCVALEVDSFCLNWSHALPPPSLLFPIISRLIFFE